MFLVERNPIRRTALKLMGWLSSRWVNEGMAAADVPRQMPMLFDPSLPPPAQPVNGAVTRDAVVPAAIEPLADVAGAELLDLVIESGQSEGFEEALLKPSPGLAGRLSAVARLNGPAARASRAHGSNVPAGRAIPISKSLEIKRLKDKRLPTSVAFRPTRKPRHSAVIIDLAAMRTQSRTRTTRRAA